MNIPRAGSTTALAGCFFVAALTGCTDGGAAASGAVGEGTRMARPSLSSPTPVAKPSADIQPDIQPDIQMVRLDGSPLARLADLPPDVADVDVSPDGRTIAFAEKVGGRVSRIFTIGIHGEKVRRLTRGPGFGPAWAPDGRRIVYSGASRPGTWDLYTIPVGGGPPRRLTDTPVLDEWHPSWSRDGSSIAFAGGETSALGTRGVYVLDTSSGRVERLTDGADAVPEWSPRGDRIAFLREPSPGIEAGYLNELMVVDADGSHEHKIAAMWLDSPPYWSPDGTKLAVYGAPNHLNQVFGVYVVDVETRERSLVTADAAGGEWWPDGRGVLVRRNARWTCSALPSRC